MMYSIVVPIYKVESFLPQCIESILKQTCKDFELILVDDGSPDSCPAICDKYAEQDSRIKVVHKENGGLVSARKAGIKVATGDYVCFVDGDDFISFDTLEVFEKEIALNGADIVCAGLSYYYGDGRVDKIKVNIEPGFYSKEKLLEDIYSRMLSTSPFFSFYIMPSLCTKCIKKTILELVYSEMPDNITLGEDAAITYPALLEASSVSAIGYNGYMYRQNENSMTHTYDRNLYTKIRNLILHLKKVELEKKWEAKNQINEYTMYLLLMAKNNEFVMNVEGSYREKKKNMKRYLDDPIFKEAIKSVKMLDTKNKIFHFCFKTGFLLPIHLYYSITNPRRTHE